MKTRSAESNRTRTTLLKLFVSGVAVALLLPQLAGAGVGPQLQSAEGQRALTRRIGTIKAISGNDISVTADSGEITVSVQPNARLLRIAPGEKDVKNANAVQLQDLHVGDTIRVRGVAADDGKSMTGLEVLVITRSTLDAVRDQVRQDWQKRGLGGLVSAVDPATGTVTISVTGMGGEKPVAVHTSKGTVFRRYAADSIKFEDAKPGSLPEIHPGDQLRARGERSADGSELTAEEIVTGSFRNLAGIVNSVDSAAGMLTLQDVLSKKSVQVKITGDSQLRKIPPEMAQVIARRLRGSSPAGTPGADSSTPSNPSGGNSQPPAAGGMGAGGMGGGMRSGGHSDFQQMLSRLPAVTLSELQKGEAVMIVATQGSGSAGTVVTLLGGVEPILQAAPNAGQSMMLAPWSLGGAPGGDLGN